MLFYKKEKSTKDRDFWNKVYNKHEFFTISLYTPNDPKEFTKNLYSHGKNTLDRLILKKFMRVLDVGCGSVGTISIPAASEGLNVHCFDISNVAIRLLKKRAGKMNLIKNMRFCIFDVNKKWPIKTGYYDAVICISTAMHIKNLKNLFNEALRVRKTGGRILIDGIWNKNSIFMKIFLWVHKLQHRDSQFLFIHKISDVEADSINKYKIIGYRMNFAKKLYTFLNFIFGYKFNFITIPLLKSLGSEKELNLKKADIFRIIS